MPRAEARPYRSTDPLNDYRNVTRALADGASSNQIRDWIIGQYYSLILEHGPVTSVEQKPFYWQIRLDAKGHQIFALNLDVFGNQHSSIIKAETDYPDVQAGWQTVVNLLTPATSISGKAVFWISPREFYQTPRVPTDQPSTYDVLNFFVVVSRTTEEVIVKGQTVNVPGGLSSKQRRLLLKFHDAKAWLPENPSPAQVVRRPVVFNLNSQNFIDHFIRLDNILSHQPDFTNSFFTKNWESIHKFVWQKVAPFITSLEQLILSGNVRGVNWLIQKIVRVIKTADAERVGLDPDQVYAAYRSQQYLMPHPLTSEDTSPYWDFITQTWKNGNCSELPRRCRHCGQKISGPNCSNCQKQKKIGKNNND